MRVAEIMSKRLVSVEMDDTLREVRQIFEHVGFHHLLVIENHELVGIVSDRDLLKAVSPNIGRAAENNRDRATLNKRVHQIMTRHPVTITREADLDEAVRRFDASGMSCLPVLDEKGHVAGVLTWRDVMKALVKLQAAAGEGDA